MTKKHLYGAADDASSASFYVYDDHTAKIELDLKDSAACAKVFLRLYADTQWRHGAAWAQEIVEMCRLSKQDTKLYRNIEFMAMFRQSGLTVDKFAARLAADNGRLRKMVAAFRKEDTETATQEADRAKATLKERGPYGSTEAPSIARHLRRQLDDIEHGNRRIAEKTLRVAKEYSVNPRTFFAKVSGPF